MAIDARTTNRNYPQIVPANDLRDDATRLVVTFQMIDADVHALFTAVAGKAPSEHGHGIAAITGLQAALDSKQTLDWRPALGDLTNVNIAGAINGQFLGRIGGVWVPVALSVSNVGGLQTALDGKAAATHPHAISDVSGLQAALEGKAAASFRPPLAEIGGVDLTTPPVAGQALVFDGVWKAGAPAGADPWACQPLGVPIPIFMNTFTAPPTNRGYRYIILTAGQSGAGGYNNGVLTSEAVSGSDPTISATAVISLAGSPFNGETVRLINTERRFLRAAESAQQVQNSALGSHLHQFVQGNGGTPTSGTIGVIMSTANTGVASTQFTGDTETRSRNASVFYIMRVL